jgi:maleylacetate reductase
VYSFRTANGGSVVGGEGALASLSEYAGTADMGRALVVTSPSLLHEEAILKRVTDTLSPLGVDVFANVRPGSPMEVVDLGVGVLAAAQHDLVVSLGGGSAVDTAKGIVWYSQQRGVVPTPRLHVAIPSTLSGAEFTADAGLSVDGHKRVLRNTSLIPTAIILDPAVLATSPRSLLRSSVLNAYAHCVEGMVSKGASPLTQAYHLHALQLLRLATSTLNSDGPDTSTADLVRLQAAAALAALNQISMGIAHVLVHSLGGLGTASHALKHGAIAPLALAFNASHAEDGLALLAGAFAVAQDPVSVIRAVRTFARHLGAPRGLADLGLTETDRQIIVDRTINDPDLLTNIRPVAGPEEIRELLEIAWTDIDVGIAQILNADTAAKA